MALKHQIYQLIDDVKRMCSGCSGTEALYAVLDELKKRLDTPLRVAVVGIMKAGKSTFMNALMGENLVYTGNLETTYTVCWFKYSEKPYITVCFRDGTEEKKEYSELARWSVRSYEEENPRINDVRYLMIHYPCDVLKSIEFIDTPGLNSIYGTDAQNTLDFLEITGSEDTIRETSSADAVIYAFSRSAGGFDAGTLKGFHKDGTAVSSPINSVGILTKIDTAWDVFGEETPVQTVSPIISSVMSNIAMKRLVYSVFPVCAKAVEGCSMLDDEEWSALERLSSVPEDELPDILYDTELFVTCEDFEIYGSVSARTGLINKIDQYGIKAICGLLAEGTDRNDIKEKLSEMCGITEVRRNLLSHFGNRTVLIKSQFIFNRLRNVSKEIQNSNSGNRQLVYVCRELENKIDELMTSIQTLNEFRILQYYYNGQLKFSDESEIEDFMQVTGEYGREPEKRLGVNSTATIKELMNVAKDKSEKWNEKASSFMLSNTYSDAASTIARSYEHIYFHLSALCDE